jgi:endo-1,4-beta-D-glucanase Y
MLRCYTLVWTALAVSGLACKLTPPDVSDPGGRGGSSATRSGGSTGASSAGSGGQVQSAGTGGSTGYGGGVGSGGQTSNSGGGGATGTAGSGGTRSSGGASGWGGTGGTMTSSAMGGVDAAVADVAPEAPPPSRGPTPKQNGVNFPFPQNRENSRCIYPRLYRNEDVQAAYDQWKQDTVTSDGAKGFRRVKRPNEHGLDANSTVSEGIAYGMLIAVYMNDQSLFDDLWQYEQQFVDGKTGLMNWYIKADGSGPAEGGSGPATDADEDMAFALVMASKQWGGQGKLGKSYLDIAKDTMIKMWNNEVWDYKYLRPGPWGDGSTLNLSYFAPAYYKLFATIDTSEPSRNWKQLTDTMYTVLSASLSASNGNADNGLVPAWCDSNGKPNGGAFGATGGPSPTNYQYDSCRTPFRIGLDWCWNGDTRAQAYVAKTSKFFSGIGAAKVVDGYDLNGNPHAQFQTGGSAQIQSAAFLGPAGVGAMSNASYQTFLNESYAIVAGRTALVGGTYYEDSWMVMSLLMMTANFLDYSAITPTQ